MIVRSLRRLARALEGFVTRRSRPRCSRCGARENLAFLTPSSRELLCATCFREGLPGSDGSGSAR